MKSAIFATAAAAALGFALPAAAQAPLKIGFVSTFIVAMITVRALLKFITSHSYAVFAWYRIAFGLVILATWQLHLIDWSTAQP